MERNGEEPALPGLDLTHNQLFFLNYAQVSQLATRSPNLHRSTDTYEQLLLLLHLYPTSMWGRCGTIVASMQLGRTPPLLTVPSLSDRLSHSPPTSSSPLSHFYVGSMWDDSRLHAARSYTSSPDSPFSLRSSFTHRPPLLHLYPTSMWGRCGTIAASMQLGRTPPLLTVPSLSDRLSHSPPTSSSVFLSFCFLALLTDTYVRNLLKHQWCLNFRYKKENRRMRCNKGRNLPTKEHFAIE